MATLARAYRRERNAAIAAVREEYRPQWQKLNADQAAEKKTFEALESSFFGRMKNAARTIGMAKHIREGGLTDAIKQGFNVTTREGERRAVFERTQEARRKALERVQAKKAGLAVQKVKDAYTAGKSELRGIFLDERGKLVASQAANRDALKQSWRERNKDRAAAWSQHRAANARRGEAKRDFDRTADPSETTKAQDRSYQASLRAKYARAMASRVQRTPGRQRDRDRGGDRER